MDLPGPPWTSLDLDLPGPLSISLAQAITAKVASASRVFGFVPGVALSLGLNPVLVLAVGRGHSLVFCIGVGCVLGVGLQFGVVCAQTRYYVWYISHYSPYSWSCSWSCSIVAWVLVSLLSCMHIQHAFRKPTAGQ